MKTLNLQPPEGYELNQVSPSEIKNFRRCWRKWFFRYVLGIKFEPSDAQAYGRKCHTDIEDYLKGEKPEVETPEARELDFQGLLPDPRNYHGNHPWNRSKDYREQIYVERWLADAGAELAGVKLVGCVDLATWFDTGELLIQDFKFRSSIDDKSPEELARNVQPLVYAYCFQHLLPRWIDYFILRECEVLKAEKGGPAVNLHQVRVSWKHVKKEVESLENTIWSMREVVDQPIEHITPSTNRCYDWGPCSHISLCNSVNFEPEKTKGFVETMDLNEFIPDEEVEETAEQVEQSDGRDKTDEQPDDVGFETVPFEEDEIPDFGAEEDDGSEEEFDPLEVESEFDGESLEGASVEEDGSLPNSPDNPTEGNPVKPGDHAPDEEPKDLDEIRIQSFDWQQISGIGEKGETKIKEWFKGRGYSTLKDLVEASFDYTKLPKVGKKGAPKVRKAVRAQANFEPDNFNHDEVPDHESVQDEESETEEDVEFSDFGSSKHEVVTKLKKGARLAAHRNTEFDPDVLSKKEMATKDPEGIVGLMEQRLGYTEAISKGEEPENNQSKSETGEDEMNAEQLRAKYKKMMKFYADKYGEKFPTDEVDFTAETVREKSVEELADYARGKVTAGQKPTEQNSDAGETASNSAEDRSRTSENSYDQSSGGGIDDPELTVLCIDCVPLNGPHRTAESIIEEAGLYEEVCDRLGVPYFDSADFKDGRETLAELVKQNITIFKGETVYLRTGIPGNKEITPYLVSLADMTFKGV